jgi:hypothetical protein
MVLARIVAAKQPAGIVSASPIAIPQNAPTAVQTPFGIQKAFMIKGQRLR